MQRKVLNCGIAFFWLIMMVLLVHKELLSPWVPARTFTYARLIPRDVLLRDQWMGIYFHQKKIGYSHTIIRAEKKDTFEGYVIENTTFFALPLLGKKQFVNFRSNALVDMSYHLKSFHAALSSSGYTFTITGRHRQGELYDLTIDSGEKVHVKKKLSPDLIFANILLPFHYIERLNPPNKFKVSILNPLTLETEHMELCAVKKEEIELQGEQTETTVVEIVSKGRVQSTAWVDNEGHVVKVAMPFSIEMVEESVLKATAIDFDMMGSIDVYNEVAIPAKIPPADSGTISYLKVKLSGVPINEKQLSSRHQKVTRQDDAYIIEISTVPSEFYSLEKMSRLIVDHPEYTQPTMLIQSDNAKIIVTAQEIVGDVKNTLRAVILLSRWVHRSVEQIPTVSVPSALEVLKKKQGDCNEIVTLFVALTRSLGIPSYPVLGLVYHNGAFFYHSWAHVYVGEWTTIDPTFNQFPVDPTHIQLAHGTISQYIDLSNIIGNLQVEVLESR